MLYHSERNRLRAKGWLVSGKLCGTFIVKSFAKLKKINRIELKEITDLLGEAPSLDFFWPGLFFSKIPGQKKARLIKVLLFLF
jgi:hypothetical protein